MENFQKPYQKSETSENSSPRKTRKEKKKKRSRECGPHMASIGYLSSPHTETPYPRLSSNLNRYPLHLLNRLLKQYC